MNYNSYIEPSYNGSDPSFNQQAGFLRPSYSTNGQGSSNAGANAPQPTHSKNKCYKRNHNQNRNHQGSSGQNLGSGKRKCRRRGNRTLRDSWGCSPSHPDGAFGRGRSLGLRHHPNDVRLRHEANQGSSLKFAKDRPLFRSQPSQMNHPFEGSFEAGQGRRSHHGRQSRQNQQHQQFTHFDDQVTVGHEGRSGYRGPPELDGPHWRPGSCTLGPNGAIDFDPWCPHPPTAPEYLSVYRDFDRDGDINMPEAPQLEPDPWRWYNLQRLLT